MTRPSLRRSAVARSSATGLRGLFVVVLGVVSSVGWREPRAQPVLRAEGAPRQLPREWELARRKTIHQPTVQELLAAPAKPRIRNLDDQQALIRRLGVEPEEVRALGRYTGHAFWAINGVLKGYDPLQYEKQYQRELRGTGQQGAPADEAQRRRQLLPLIQGDIARLRSLLGKLPASPGITYRVERMKRSVFEQLERNQGLVTNGFWSTERDLDRAMAFFGLRTAEDRYPVLFCVAGRSGRRIDAIASYGENETLFADGTRFRVLAIDKQGFERTAHLSNDRQPIFVWLEER